MKVRTKHIVFILLISAWLGNLSSAEVYSTVVKQNNSYVQLFYGAASISTSLYYNKLIKSGRAARSEIADLTAEEQKALDDIIGEAEEAAKAAGSLDHLVAWASKNGLSHLTRNELDDIFKFVDYNLDFANRVANSTKEIQSATSLTELAGKLNLPVIPTAKSLTPYQTRVWYNWRKAKIGDLIDKKQTLENQAKQAVNMRNEIRSGARKAMIDSDIADFLDTKELNKTWEQLVKEKIDKGFVGDAIYQEIINSSMKGRPTVDNVFKIPSLK